MTEKFMVPVELPGDATSALHAVPKQQLDPSNSQLAILAAQMEVRRLADLGYFVCSGLALTANATPTKLDMAAGVSFQATTELNAAAQTAISTTITSMADATNPKWVVVELDSSNVVQFNQGTAAATPVFPTITVTRATLGFLYVPANATNVDTLLTTSNGNAKLIDARNVRSVHLARRVATDTSGTVLTNPTALTSILAAAVSIPANSISVGDTFIIEAGITYINSQNASTLQVQAALGAVNPTSASLAASALGRPITVRCVLQAKAIGASGSLTAHSVTTFGNILTNPIVAEFDSASSNGIASDTTAAVTIDLKVKVTTSSSTSTFTLDDFTVTKIPA